MAHRPGAVWPRRSLAPAQSGPGGCIADIGTHAFNLATFVTGLVPIAVLADLTAFGPDRALDDNTAILLRFGGVPRA